MNVQDESLSTIYTLSSVAMSSDFKGKGRLNYPLSNTSETSNPLPPFTFVLKRHRVDDESALSLRCEQF